MARRGKRVFDEALLARLCEADGVSGHEDVVADILQSELEALADDIHTDPMKNLVATRRGRKGSRISVMLAGHMDEIGFLVYNVDEDGFVSLAPVGGWQAESIVGHPVRIHCRSGRTVEGVVHRRSAWLPEHRSKELRLDEIYVDLGLPGSRVGKLVSRGDWVSMASGFRALGDCYLAKAFDDRVGVFIIAEAFRRYVNPSITVHAVGTSQEEVGLRGAASAAQELKPTIGVAVDITGAGDTPGHPARLRTATLGKGVAIKIMDSSVISSPGLVEFMRDTAESKGIDHQLEVLLRGGTDTAAIQRWGSSPHVVCLSIPTRYGHSPSAVIHRHDVETAIELLVAFLERAHEWAGAGKKP
ncbi:M42 family metallopeptidase [Candidatus Fermentibacterales bacterium]|nr:M42 family metallopeptidase [Candidatus Fermentibacterales bacterium]